MSVTSKEWAALRAPFPPEDIEWRVGQSGFTAAGKPWIKALAYITARAVMDRLDSVFGPDGWSHELRPFSLGNASGMICRLSAGGVVHEDAADTSDIEALKGAASGALKRAAVSFGIGRYLYDLKDGFAEISERGQFSAEVKDKRSGKSEWVKWNPPKLPDWALPKPEKAAKKPADQPTEPPKAPDQGTGAAPKDEAFQSELKKLVRLYNAHIEVYPEDAEQAKAICSDAKVAGTALACQKAIMELDKRSSALEKARKEKAEAEAAQKFEDDFPGEYSMSDEFGGQ